MIRAGFSKLETVLCLGSHSDDIEIGCGGTVLKLIQDYPQAHFSWIVFSAKDERAEEAERSANCFLKAAASRSVDIKQYVDGFFPYVGGEIKSHFEQLKKDTSPDLILTHYGQDLHQDHRLIAELTWNTFRDHLILEYEIPKYDGGLGSPNFFVPISDAIRRQKMAYILENFRTQSTKRWFSEDTFQALMRLRGMESNSETSYAEAFYCRKLCL
jgi:LmbE family N-acetylglucosaminyl deacetylase